MSQLFSSTDMALARRIEAGHAHSATASNTDASVEEMAGGWCIFHQVDSQMTQAIGIGLNGAMEANDLDRLEAFFHQRGSAAILDLCALADPSVLAMLHERAYSVREISNVLVRRLDPDEQFGHLPVEAVPPQDFRDWVRMVMQGFSGQDEISDEQLGMMASSDPKLEPFFGLWNGLRTATAAMDVDNGLATFFGDATRIPARGHGLQLALIRHRLKRAAQLGCDLATASVVPGSISHRNYERARFQLLYARVMLSSRKSNI